MDEILAELTEPLYRFLLRMTRDRELAADLTQETLLRAWRGRRWLRDPRARRVWVFRIAVNLCSDDRRRKARVESRSLDLETHPSTAPSPETLAVNNEIQRRVAEELDRLPGRQRETMYLHLVEQLSPREIARVLSIDAGTVRSSLAAARKRLRTRLSELRPVSDEEKPIIAESTRASIHHGIP